MTKIFKAQIELEINPEMIWDTDVNIENVTALIKRVLDMHTVEIKNAELIDVDECLNCGSTDIEVENCLKEHMICKTCGIRERI